MDGVQLPQGQEPLRGGSLLFTIKFTVIPDTCCGVFLFSRNAMRLSKSSTKD